MRSRPAATPSRPAPAGCNPRPPEASNERTLESCPHRHARTVRRLRVRRNDRRGDPADRLRGRLVGGEDQQGRSEEHTSELQSLMRISYAVFCLKKKKTKTQ